jgi:hypothetical protein
MARHSHEIFDSKGPARGLVQRARHALGWHGPEGGPEGGRTGGNSSGPEAGLKAEFTAGSEGGLTSGFTAGSEGGLTSGLSAGEASGSGGVAQPGSTPAVHPESGSTVHPGEPSGVELHVVDGRLIACRPGEPPPLSVREHTQAFLGWLKVHDKVPGVEVPVTTLEHFLYWDFLRETGLRMKPWRAVLTTLVKLGVRKYQADWREPTGDGPTPVVVKITKPRRAKVVKVATADRKRA